MSLTIHRRDTDLIERAARALGAWRAFETAAQAARADLNLSTRVMQNHHLASPLEALFSKPVLDDGQALLAALHDAAAQAGGAPTPFQTRDRQIHLVSGTEAGGRIQAAADRLADFQAQAWRIHDHQAAAAIILGHREAPAGGLAADAATPPERDAPA